MNFYRLWLVILFLTFHLDIFAQNPPDLPALSCEEGIYGLGAGQRDITGPIAESIMMGYAELSQDARGLHTRLRSRAFVLYDPCSQKFNALVVADLAMIFSSVKEGVLKYLEREAPHVFSHQNVFLSATHTHNGPGGYAFYPLYNLSTLGFSEQNYQTIVRGIAESILTAFRSMVAGQISYSEATFWA